MFRRLARASLVPVLLAAGACAAQADDVTVRTGSSAVAALRSAPDAAAEAGSGHFEMTVSIDTPEGVFDLVGIGGFSGDRMRMEMDLGAVLAEAATASGETVPDGFDEPMEIVADGSTVYMRVPMLQALTGDAGWLVLTPDDIGKSGDLGLGAGANDPTQLLETLRGVTSDIEDLGPDEVRGVATTRFRATIDQAKALDEVAPDQRALLRSQLEGFGGGLAELPVDVWIDGDGLARRIAIDLDALIASTGVGGSATVTIDFFDYGEPVEVVVPDASETTPFTEVLGALGGFG